MMEAIPRDYGQGQFDAFCKKVLKNEARAYLRNMKRQRDRETMFSDLPQHELDKLCTVDRYPSDSFVFSSHGYDLHIDNELVADAFANLPQQEQSILILYCVLDMADGEIATTTRTTDIREPTSTGPDSSGCLPTSRRARSSALSLRI